MLINGNKKYQYLKLFFSLLAIVIGVELRFLVALRGYNLDFRSWVIVADIASRGENVYAETARYNYGPVWFTFLSIIIHFVRIFPNYQEVIFRYLIISSLSLVDIGIFIILYRQYTPLIAYLFLFSPISIIITGYHNQFDNCALFIGLWATRIFENNFHTPLTWRKWLGLLLFGVSLLTKHIFFLFPLWIAVKHEGIKNKILIISIPIFLFLIGFLPYWQNGKEGILHNVFQYTSFQNPMFYILFIPTIIQLCLTSKQIWILLLFIGAFVYRTYDITDSLLLYTGVLLVFSPAIANHYLVIVIPLVCRFYKNIFFVLYMIIATWHLLIDFGGLHFSSQYIPPLSPNIYYAILVGLLYLGLIKQLNLFCLFRVLQAIYAEIMIQFGRSPLKDRNGRKRFLQ